MKTFGTKIVRASSNYLFVIKMIWRTTPMAFIALGVLSLLESLLPLIPMWLLKNILDLLTTADTKDEKALYQLVMMVSGIGLASFATKLAFNLKSTISSLTFSRVGKEVIYTIQNKSAQLDLRFYDTPEFYKKLDNARRVLARNWDFLLIAPFQVFGQTLFLFASIGILASFNVWLVPVVIVGVLPSIITHLNSRKKEMIFFSGQIAETRKIKYSEDLLSEKSFAKEIRLFGLSDYIIGMTQKLFKTQYKDLKKLKKSMLTLNMAAETVSVGTLFGSSLFISLHAFWGTITLGSWQFLTTAVQSIQSAMDSIINILALSYEDELYIDILMDFLNSEPEIKLEEGKSYPFEKTPPNIEFRNVNFSYPGSVKKTINNLSFTIRPGEKVALVGMNGAGKSTIIKLLSRLYDPEAGQILFNQSNVKEYKAKELYKLFGVVFQDFSKYGFTLRENIGLSDIGNPVVDPDRTKNAAAASGADKLVDLLPDGYETYLTKDFDINGCSDLSGGQWQKVVIARAFYRDSPIVILDEPTASLDPKAEQDIYDQFYNLCKDKSAILISHRLSSVRMVDRIFFLQDGTIKESGTHAELMALNGEYAEMFNLQKKQYNIQTEPSTHFTPLKSCHPLEQVAENG